MIGLYIFMGGTFIGVGVLFYIMVIKPTPKVTQSLLDDIRKVDCELQALGLPILEAKKKEQMSYYRNLLQEKINQVRMAYQNKKKSIYSKWGKDHNCQFLPQDTYSALGTVARNGSSLFYNSNTQISHEDEIRVLAMSSYPHQTLYSFQGWTARYSLHEILSLMKNGVETCSKFKSIGLDKIAYWVIYDETDSSQRGAETAAGAVAGALLLGGLAGAVIGGISSQKSYDKQDRRVLRLYVNQSDGKLGYETIVSIERHGKESFEKMCRIFQEMLPDKKRKPRELFDEV